MADVTGRPDEAGAYRALRLRLRRWLGDRSASGVAQRFAGFAYLFRIVNAGLAFLTQIVLARWIGAHEFGIYVYVWTWVLLLGTVTNIGLASSSQRFIPTYAKRGEWDLLRGFLHGGRWLVFALGAGFAGLGALGLVLFGARLDPVLMVPLYLGLACLPLFVVTEIQEGIARTYDWASLAMAPAYLVRPLLLLGLLAAMHLAGLEADAVAAMWAALVSTWATALWQMAMLNRRLPSRVPPGPRRYAPGTWLRISFPQFLVEGFYLSLTYCDVIVLERFATPAEVATYYAATKLVSLVAFVYFAVAAASAHRFTEYHVADRPEELNAFVHASIRWTFLPSLAMALVILALGKPLLWLFGPGFVDGYPLLAILVVGLLARASIGPVEKLLNMLGHQGICAVVYAFAFLANIGLNLALVPWFGLTGAAVATAAALVLESILLFLITKRRLGLHVFYWGGPKRQVS
ncbi:lipopolysaccharide biosynthesis protein [Labrys wisconsinensis]|uniref:O-antigen/teichoic acid export membrane protein n=1 Tax=Labrys wisconsinensis TaxID=425677 RepID=A0ABU0J3I3_9HYPH|nr:lipopolysaccharide biosynthesis protein [Labrys wisconsinensis]MDQ0468165.1 O-antigen/teichoic acid export membrane protein [Labrys wisconsinensis]